MLQASYKQWWASHRADLLVFGVYALFTTLATFPTAFRLAEALYSDTYYIYLTWWRKFSLLNGLDFYFQSYSQAPFGADQITPGFSGLITALALLAIPFGEIVAFNLMILLSFFLSGVFTYYLARHCGLGRQASFVAGIVFGFSRFALANIRHDVDVAQQWVLPLFVLALLNLRQKQTPAAAVLTGGAFALAGYMHPYFAYYAVIIALVFVFVDLAGRVKENRQRHALTLRWIGLYVLAGLVGIIAYMPDLYPTIAAMTGQNLSPIRNSDMLSQPAFELFYWSSRPWEFLLPPADHLLYGAFSERIYAWIANIHRLDFTPPLLERSIPSAPDMYWYWASSDWPFGRMYLGITNLVAGTYAFLQWRKRRKTIDAKLTDEDLIGIAFALALFVVGFLFTQPPYLPFPGPILRHLWEPLHNVIIPMPNLLLAHFAPVLHYAGDRTTLLMMLALAVLAAYGFECFTKLRRKPMRQSITLVAFIAVLAFEYGYIPHIALRTVPEVYERLAEYPRETIIIEYPFGSRQPSVFQFVHELPVANSISRPASPVDNIAYIENLSIGSLDALAVGPKLAALGVRYVINSGARLSRPPDGLSPAFTTDTAEVFEVTAEPAPLVVLETLRDGLWVSEADWGWQGSEYLIYVWNPFPHAVEVTITLDSPEDVGDTAMMIVRTLTPHPETIIDRGSQITNPYIPPDYPDEPILAESVTGGLIFRSVLIQPGETMLTLRWAAGGEGEAYPDITDVHFALMEAEGS